MSETVNTSMLDDEEWKDVRYMIDYFDNMEDADGPESHARIFDIKDIKGRTWHVIPAVRESNGERALIMQRRVDEDSARSIAVMPESGAIEVFNESQESLLNTDVAEEEVKQGFEEARSMGMLVPNEEELADLRDVLAVGRLDRELFDQWADQFTEDNSGQSAADPNSN